MYFTYNLWLSIANQSNEGRTFNSRWSRLLCSIPQSIADKSLACIDIYPWCKMSVLNLFHSSHVWLNASLPAQPNYNFKSLVLTEQSGRECKKMQSKRATTATIIKLTQNRKIYLNKTTNKTNFLTNVTRFQKSPFYFCNIKIKWI